MIWHAKSMRCIADKAREKKVAELISRTEKWLEEVVASGILHEAEKGAYCITYSYETVINYDIPTITRILRDEKGFTIHVVDKGNLTISWKNKHESHINTEGR